ncbi:MAG: TolC family protein [Verrucomicrobiales bacterium]|nr:TolC family protein [Verrucomicrobiales bacterium]
MKLRFWVGSMFVGAVMGAAQPSPPPPAGSRAEPSSALATTPLLDAVARAPMMSSARARAAAARNRLGSAGRFPDPELEGMISQVSKPTGENPMWEINLRQPLPKAGERAADRERAAAVVSLAEAEYAVMAGELAADTAMALAESEAATGRVALLARQIQRTEQTLAAVDARVATGGGRIADRLALQTSIAAMRLELEREEQRAADALADARGRLGLSLDAPLPPYAAPTAPEVDIERAPTLQLAVAKGAEARAMARMARASGRPMTAVGLRFEREEDPMGSMDTIGIAFMTELPWRGLRYARAEEKGAYAEVTASRAEAEAVRHRFQALLTRVQRAERLVQTARRLSGETHQRLDAEYEALIRAAGTGSPSGGGLPVLMILEILDRQTATETQVIEAEVANRVARAELWRFAPVHLFPVNP